MKRDSHGKSDERLEQARQYFRDHHAGIEPDASFAARVTARLNREPSELLGWAAWRMLPAALTVIVVLVWFSVQVPTSSPSDDVAASLDSMSSDSELQSPMDDVLAWVLDDAESTP